MVLCYFVKLCCTVLSCNVVNVYVLYPCMCWQEEARRHFGCPILEGMELENQGGMGTELNHWEKRLLEVKGGLKIDGIVLCLVFTVI